MKGVSGIVATAILLALTVAGGLLLYSYVTGYLTALTNSANVVIRNAYYISTLKKLYIAVENIGSSPANITEIEVILYDGTTWKTASLNRTLLPAGGGQTISMDGIDKTPLYVIVKYSNDKQTDPYPVRVIG